MPRTRTCPVCDGTGNEALSTICRECDGNGYVAADVGPAEMAAALQADAEAEPTLHDALERLRAQEAAEGETFKAGDYVKATMTFDGEQLVLDGVVKTDPPDVDFAAPPTPGRMANQTWRILEEQRMAASETILECEAEIERWTAKMVDATKAMRMAEAGQAVLSGAA